MNLVLKDYRCEHCGKLLFRGDIQRAAIEIKCKNCKNLNLINSLGRAALTLSDKKEFYQKSGETHGKTATDN